MGPMGIMQTSISWSAASTPERAAREGRRTRKDGHHSEATHSWGSDGQKEKTLELPLLCQRGKGKENTSEDLENISSLGVISLPQTASLIQVLMERAGHQPLVCTGSVCFHPQTHPAYRGRQSAHMALSQLYLFLQVLSRKNPVWRGEITHAPNPLSLP